MFGKSVLSVAVAILMASATASWGQVSLDIEDVTVPVAGVGATTGSFDIFITPNVSDEIDSFTFQVRRTDPNLSFTGITASSTFPGATSAPLGTEALSISWLGNVAGTGGKTFASADTAVTVKFSVPEGVTGTFDVLWGFKPSVDSSSTNLDGNSLGLSQDAGSVTVTPEPTSLALLGAGGLMLLRRRRA